MLKFSVYLRMLRSLCNTADLSSEVLLVITGKQPILVLEESKYNRAFLFSNETLILITFWTSDIKTNGQNVGEDLQ